MFTSWREVETSTLYKCFEEANFIFPTDEPNIYNRTCATDDEEDEDDDIPLSVLKLSYELSGCGFSDLVQIDQDINICDTNTIDEDISYDPGDEETCVPSISDAHI